MKKTTISTFFDFNTALLVFFKKLEIDEVDAFVLMIINNLLESGEKLITPDSLKKYLSISIEEVDKRIANFLSKGYITLEENKKDFVFSLQSLYEKLLTFINTKSNNSIDDAVYTFFEEELGRPLNSIEVLILGEWRSKDFTKEEIIDAWCEAVSRKVRTIQYTDSILLNRHK